MTNDRAHVLDDLAAYALGSLDEIERARVDAHLVACEACAARLLECRAVVGALPVALPPAAPPPEVWTTIQAEVRRRRPRAVAWRRLVHGGGWGRTVRWASAAALVGGLVIWNVSVQREVWRYAEGPQVEKLARRPARLVVLTGTTRQQASARVFAAVDGRSGHMAVAGLAPLPAGRLYQLWFFPKTAPPVSAATFTVDANGRAWVVIRVPGPLEDTRAIVVTEEAEPGAVTPSGVSVLAADQWR